MKVISSILIFALFSIGDLIHGANDSPGAIQIFVPVNNTLQLQENELKSILEAENIKDRHVVVVSIAGVYRQGKSFLLNLLIRYLKARYQKHDVADWLGENSNSELNGFNWRGGRRPETQGIWMYSQIFTHDYENGEKVAIVLLDTQGIFDSETSMAQCTTIFAISTMLSSLQCFNLMHNIREYDLQHLELFAEYGRLALQQSDQTPFQSLLFIVRDWAFSDDTGYGMQRSIINEVLTEHVKQPLEMRQLRAQIKKSFSDINSFSLPYPGNIVASKRNFTGNIQEIDPEFRDYIKELAPAILAPENLVIKEINGQKLRAQDLVEYIHTYSSIFHGDSLPKPKSLLTATAEVQNFHLFNECMEFYIQTMETNLRENGWLEDIDLQKRHDLTKADAIMKFHEKPKLGDSTITLDFERQLNDAIEEQFLSIKQRNSEKHEESTNKKAILGLLLLALAASG